MAKQRSNYEGSFAARVSAWIKDGRNSLDESNEASLGIAARQSALNTDAIAQRETAIDKKQLEAAYEERVLAERFQKWSATKGAKWYHGIYALLAIIICAALIWILLSTVAALPVFGREDNPVNNEVYERYIEKGMEETGAINAVSGMILNYRAFDTLGESFVLFVAACSVILLLKLPENTSSSEYLEAMAYDRHYEPKNDLILQTATRYLFPILLMFSIYVWLNGHLSPGGGFSGGAVLGAALILFVLAYGSKSIRSFFNHSIYNFIKVSALCLYALILLYYAYTGANGLPSIIPLGTPGRLFSAGFIPAINVAVGFEVACTMFGFYAYFRKGEL